MLDKIGLSEKENKMRRRKSLIFLLISLLFLFFFRSCKSPQSEDILKKAVIIMAVDRTPILMEWEFWTDLWCMEPALAVGETNGVGVTVTEAKSEFIYQGAAYEPQTIEGGRINANESFTLYLHICTQYFYEKVRFTIRGTDDNGHSITKIKEYDLHYVQFP
jgi:hypothetical protein